MKKVAEYLPISKKEKYKIVSDMNKKLKEHQKYICEFGVDMPEIRDWNWND